MNLKLSPPSEYYLGAPLWSLAAWKGSLFTSHAKPAEFLEQYAQRFNAVEGNTTFYATPSAALVERWKQATPTHFRFSFKFPREVTHTAHLKNVASAVTTFLHRMQPLESRLHFMLQLPASFRPSQLEVLAQFLKQLPKSYPYALEVRHPDFFTQLEQRNRLNDLLLEHGVDRVIFDSRALHAAPTLDKATEEAQLRKPRLPVQLDTTASSPLLRHIGHSLQAGNETALAPWVAQISRWITQGKRPYVYLHTPSNQGVPELADWFQRAVQQRLEQDQVS